MGKTTGIEWATATWNPWRGCTKISEGCAHCYMYRGQAQYGQDPAIVVRTKTLRDPLRWKEPRRLFVCSWSDFWHPAADTWRDEAWEIMRQADWHTYLLLTKRPERITVPWSHGREWPHIWGGITGETQARLDERWPHLAQAPFAVRWLSAEPLLGPLDLWWPFNISHACPNCGDGSGFEGERCSCGEGIYLEQPTLDWVVVAGESGGPHERRLVWPSWNERDGTVYQPKPDAEGYVRAIRDQCQDAGVPFFFKAWGGPRVSSGGRLLDGRTWDEFPEPPNALAVMPCVGG